MKIRRIATALLAALLAFPLQIKADEGMWLVNMLEKGLMKNMKQAGLKLPANVIYDDSAVSISDAVVSLDFGCTGSMISEKGLLITNHHCAYSDVHSISTPEHNYLEDGFWAFDSNQEIPIPGKKAFFLKRVLDVTDEVAHLCDSAAKTDRPAIGRRLSFLMEKRYKELYPDCEVSLDGMWRGEKYYMCIYKTYSDLRLVAAPPVCIAAYGGDVDNWEWPQHKGDFAIYRIYTAPDGSDAEYCSENIPLVPENHLKISAKGVKTGDFTMVMGYPGRTNRYNSSFGIDFIGKDSNPVTVKVQGDVLNIMNRHMEADPAVRLMYADDYFGISNVQELRAGEVMTFRRYGVADIRREKEKELQEWIDAAPDRMSRYGTLLSDMAKAYDAVREERIQTIWYRETLIRGCESTTSATKVDTWLSSVVGRDNKDPEAMVKAMDGKNEQRIYGKRNSGLEKDRFVYAIREASAHITPERRGEVFNGMLEKFNGNADALAKWAWDNTYLNSRENFHKFVSQEHKLSEYTEDPAFKLLRAIQTVDFNKRVSAIEESVGKINEYEKLYTNAFYEMYLDKGVPQYPDANSTMRLTYGTVGPVSPADGKFFDDKSTTAGILEKYDPTDYEFHINDRQLQLLKGRDWGKWIDKDGSMHVNFISNNDITGGNSGSPVMNAKGELVGLAFDGNKESLCGDSYFHPEYNKCVNVDIRYVLWILDKYAGMNYLFNEIEIIQ